MTLPRETIKTTCSYCGVGCGIEVTRDSQGRLSVAGDENHPVNRGMLCSKGRTIHHVVQHQEDRLLHPQMRRSRSHPLEQVDWDKALDRAADVFKSVIDRFGPEAVGFYVSGQCLTEEYYVANKLMKGFIGGNNIDTNSRLCMSSAVVGYKLALGDDTCPISYEDIELGSCFMIAGANPAWCHPILFRRLEQHKAANPDVKIIVVDPRETQSCALADMHLQIQPGTDVVLYNALARELRAQGYWDYTFIENHCNGGESLKETIFKVSNAEAARICRIPPEQIVEAARLIGESNAFQTWWAMGLNQSSNGVDKNLALLNLSLVTGQIGKPGAGPFSLTGQPNAMGGREVGGLSNLLAAHRDLADPAERAFVADYWKSGPIAAKPGLTATEMFEALESGSLKAIWIICTNPAVSLPNLNQVESALKKARFVVVQDISALSDTVAYADLVLPAAGWLEKQGTMTNSERRVMHVPKLVDAPGEALPDVDILCRFAEKMGWGDAFDYGSESDIFDEHCRLTAGTPIDMAGMSYKRLKESGSLQWPCPDAQHPGTPRLFEDKQFHTADKRAAIHGIDHASRSEVTTDKYPLVLTTGRIRDQWHTMTRTGKVKKLRQHLDTPFVEIHPTDAKIHLINAGDTVTLYNDRGAVRARAQVTDTIKAGVVFLPMHWGKSLQHGDARANLLTSPEVDPKSKEPDFKFAAVALSKAHVSNRRVVVVGGGTAALAFVTEYRKRNQTDELVVFGQEAHGFYNRILLPDLIGGECDWPSLQTATADRLEADRITFHSGVKITAIQRDTRLVTDSNGARHPYDKLVLATGSRPALPPDAPRTMKGVFTLRTRNDADAILSHVTPESRCIVVGGGLLGLELVAALRHRGADCRLLHRSGKLMGRQLDSTAAQLLAEELADQDIAVHFNETVATIHGNEMVQGIRTRNGRYFPCDALFFATGTTPNMELAIGAGLACVHGVQVDDGMLTNDPNIVAIGEIAEHRHRRYGTTPAAQDQAAVAAAQITGDTWTRYGGNVPFNVLKIRGLSLCSIGQVFVPQGESNYEEITLLDRTERYYQKCIVYNNRLVGAILMGDMGPMATLKELVASGLELDETRRTLLRSGMAEARDPVEGPLICSCNQVGAGNLTRMIEGGCHDMEGLCNKTGAGLGCGSCKPEVAKLLEQHRTLATTG